MLLWSVTATAGIPASATALMNGLIRTRPSTREYSVWTRRWTKGTLIFFLIRGWGLSWTIVTRRQGWGQSCWNDRLMAGLPSRSLQDVLAACQPDPILGWHSAQQAPIGMLK